MNGRLAAVLLGALALCAWDAPVAADDKKPAAAWIAEEAAAGNLQGSTYELRIKELVDDLNAVRKSLGDLPPLAWDAVASEGHYRHARYLLHHMKDMENSGGVTDFTKESEDELATEAGRRAGRIAIFGLKYVEQGTPLRPTTEDWVVRIGSRLPLIARSAKNVYVGFAQAKVEEGEWQGWNWAVLVVSTDADYRYRARSMREDPANAEPVVIPRDGATDVPLLLRRESPELIPTSLRTDAQGKLRRVGFPITVSYFGGSWIASGTTAQMFELVKVEKKEAEEKPKRRKPGAKRKKKKKKKKGAKKEYEIQEREVPCLVSTPTTDPLAGKGPNNMNSVVIVPHAALTPSRKYRVRLEVFVGDGKETKRVELMTTFTTRAED